MVGLASVIVPAHNEQLVIGRCLTNILTGLPAGTDVVVVCNGCTDATADIARTFGDLVTVVELTSPGKIGALNAGDEIARGFPRAYVDADVEISGADLDEVARQMTTAGAAGASPSAAVDTSRSSLPIRAYYRHWATTPYRQDAPISGSGVYVLSAHGRARFDRFPDVIADDLFVHRLLPRDLRLSTTAARVVVHPPTNVRDLIAIKARARAGERQVAQLIRSGELPRSPPAQGKAGSSGRIAWLLKSFTRPRTAADALVYVAIRLLARFRDVCRVSGNQRQAWLRDESSRAPVA